jgi:tripartite-type tricarboxylate transporter receptor subunit TctC
MTLPRAPDRNYAVSRSSSQFAKIQIGANHSPYSAMVPRCRRSPAAPDIPSLAERGVPGFDAAGWGMVVAPAHTPAPIVAKLYDAFRAVESRPEVRNRLTFLGLTPQTSPPPEQLQAFIDGEFVRWGKVVKSAGLAATE